MIRNVEAVVVETEKEIVYKIPKTFGEPVRPRIEMEGDSILVRTEKIVPVASSPLDAFRGRGSHARKNHMVMYTLD